jgi:hypothetical protein
MAGVVLDLSHRIVVLLFTRHELPALRQRILVSVWMADLLEIAWGGIACFEEETALREQMLTDAGQHRFLVLSRQKELKDIFQHLNRSPGLRQEVLVAITAAFVGLSLGVFAWLQHPESQHGLADLLQATHADSDQPVADQRR